MPIDRIVINASPLICLFRSNQANLLPLLFNEILIPDAVWQEVTQSGKSDQAAINLQNLPHSTRITVRSIPSEITAWDLGVGETEVLALAYEHRPIRAMLDDRAARRCASTFCVLARQQFQGNGGFLAVLLEAHALSHKYLIYLLFSDHLTGFWLPEGVQYCCGYDQDPVF